MKSRAPERIELEALIERARNHVMSPEEREAQQRSWVIGNVMLSNPDMTRARANQIYDEIVGRGEGVNPMSTAPRNFDARIVALVRATNEFIVLRPDVSRDGVWCVPMVTSVIFRDEDLRGWRSL